MNSKRTFIPGLIYSIALLIADVLFFGLLIHTRLIPAKLLILIAAAMILVTLLVFLLSRDSRRIGRSVISIIITVLIIAVYGTGCYYITNGVNTLQEITETSTELSEVSVYVRADDPTSDIYAAKGYTFGILKDLDRDNTDKTLIQLEDTVGTELKVVEYPGIGELVNSLLVDGNTNAIIMNSAYLELLSEMEGFENAASQLKELHTEKIETVITRVVTKDQDGNIVKTTDENGNPVETDVSVNESDENRNYFSMYISGIDTRGTISTVSRSDVNIIATVNTDTHQVLLVSTPRDFYVPLPISDGIPDKLTHAGIYGIDCSMGALEMLYDTTLDYYFRVNFSGFEDIIDSLDGVSVYSDVSFGTGDYYFYEGENYLYGSAALAFARERYAFASGDRQRGKNQMAVIKAVINKAVSSAMLTNFSSVMESIAGSFQTSMPYEVMAELVRQQLSSGADWNIVSYSVDGYGDSQKPYSLSTYAYVMVPYQDTVDHAIELMNQVKNGEILTQE